jgi:nucleotide-binding universal stress UspA family protein
VGEEARITTVVAPLDGSSFSELMLPHAVDLAKSVGAQLTLVQVLSPEARRLPGAAGGDVLESSYVQGWAKEIHRQHGIEADWEVLHGDPAEAICKFVNARPGAMLAMASHTRVGLRKTIFGSVTRECVRPRRPRAPRA